MITLEFPMPNGCMECPLSRSDEMGYPLECQWQECPFKENGKYLYDPESGQIALSKTEGLKVECAFVDDVYTTNEIAKMLKVCKETVRRWIRCGALKSRMHSRKGGNCVYYGDLASFCLNNPKYLDRICLRVTKKELVYG